MNNLATTNSTEVTIVSKNEVYLSQRKCEELLGIPQSTISRWIRENGSPFSTNEINQLDAKSVQKLAFLGHSKGYEKCLSFIELTCEAGITAFILTLGGYKLNAEPESKPEEPPYTISREDMATLLAVLSRSMDKPKPIPIIPIKTVPGSNTSSAEVLLKGSGVSSRLFHMLAEKAGLVTRRQCYTSNGKLRKFCKLTDMGLSYGINQLSSYSTERFQILWFTDKFDEVLQLAMQHMPK